MTTDAKTPTPTPRTDYIVANYRPYAGSPEAERSFDRMSHCSRQLERENAALREQLASLGSSYETCVTAIKSELAAAEQKRVLDVRQCWILSLDHAAVATAIRDAFPDIFKEQANG